MTDNIYNDLAEALGGVDETATEEVAEVQEVAPEENNEIAEENTTEEANDNEVVVEEEEEVAEKSEEEIEFEKNFEMIPKDWSEEEREVFKKALASKDDLTSASAEMFIDRYNNLKKGFIQKTTEIKQFKKEYEAVDDIFKPYENVLKQGNVSKADYIKRLVDIDKKFGENPVDTIKDLIRMKGLKASDLGFEDFSLQDIENYDSVDNNKVKLLEQEIQYLRNKIETTPLEVQVNNFANAVDNEGKLMHPLFNDLRPVMAGIIQKDPSTTLEQAYKKALKVFDNQELTEQKKEVSFDIEARKQKAKRAIQASKSISTTGNSKDFGKMTLVEELADRLGKF